MIFEKAIELIGKSVKLGIVLEVVDDPDDSSGMASQTKPIDVWIFLAKKRYEKDQLSADVMANSPGSECVRNITKSTPIELRTYALTTTDDGYLHVVAVPTPEWAGKYKERAYEPLAVKTGRIYNFGVSLPSK